VILKKKKRSGAWARRENWQGRIESGEKKVIRIKGGGERHTANSTDTGGAEKKEKLHGKKWPRELAADVGVEAGGTGQRESAMGRGSGVKKKKSEGP